MYINSDFGVWFWGCCCSCRCIEVWVDVAGRERGVEGGGILLNIRRVRVAFGGQFLLGGLWLVRAPTQSKIARKRDDVTHRFRFCLLFLGVSFSYGLSSNFWIFYVLFSFFSSVPHPPVPLPTPTPTSPPPLVSSLKKTPRPPTQTTHTQTHPHPPSPLINFL